MEYLYQLQEEVVNATKKLSKTTNTNSSRTTTVNNNDIFKESFYITPNDKNNYDFGDLELEDDYGFEYQNRPIIVRGIEKNKGNNTTLKINSTLKSSNNLRYTCNKIDKMNQILDNNIDNDYNICNNCIIELKNMIEKIYLDTQLQSRAYMLSLHKYKTNERNPISINNKMITTISNSNDLPFSNNIKYNSDIESKRIEIDEYAFIMKSLIKEDEECNQLLQATYCERDIIQNEIENELKNLSNLEYEINKNTDELSDKLNVADITCTEIDYLKSFLLGIL
jgi:hypothetical protein